MYKYIACPGVLYVCVMIKLPIRVCQHLWLHYLSRCVGTQADYANCPGSVGTYDDPDAQVHYSHITCPDV